jgi:hypothetical protein
VSATAFVNIAQVEASLWEAADQLRANAKLPSSEYCMPVLGVIFLRHASNRYQDALKAIEADQAAGNMPKRPLVPGDFIKRRALMLPEEARYDSLLKLPSDTSLGGALVDAMNAVEASFEPLAGQLAQPFANGRLRLAPAYDVLPTNSGQGYQEFICGDLGRDSTLANAMSQCEAFGLLPAEAATEVTAVIEVVNTWQAHFEQVGVSARDIQSLAERIDDEALLNQRERFDVANYQSPSAKRKRASPFRRS